MEEILNLITWNKEIVVDNIDSYEISALRIISGFNEI